MKNAVAKNLVASYVNFMVFAVAGLVVNPILVVSLGPVAFGSWKACQRFLDIVSVGDGRATQALKWVVANRTGVVKDPHHVQREIGASLIVWLFWLPLVLGLCALVVYVLPHLISGTSAGQESEIRLVGVILAFNIVLAGALMVPDAALVGANQGYRSMTISTLAFVLSNFAMIVAVDSGYGIAVLAAIVTIAAILNSIATWLIARRSLPWWGVRRPRTADLSMMARFSGWVFGWAFIEKILVSTEVVLLSIAVGVTAVTDYTFTSYIVQFALSICLLTASAYMPRMGSLLSRGDLMAAAKLIQRVRELVLSIATIAASCILLLNESFVAVWVGESHFMGSTVNLLMALGFVQLAVIRCDGQIHDTGLRIHNRVLLGGASSIACIAGGLATYEMSNSLSLMLGSVIIARLLMPFTFPRLVRELVPGVRIKWQRFVLSAAIILVCYAIGRVVSAVEVLSFVLYLLLSVFVVVPIVGATLLSRDTRKTIVSRIWTSCRGLSLKVGS